MDNLNKKIAAAIQLAHNLHEQSFIKCQNKGFEVSKLHASFGDYTVSWEDCWQQACKDQELPDDLWYVLHLANHWYNDLQWWAEQVLAGKPLEFTEVDIDEDGCS